MRADTVCIKFAFRKLETRSQRAVLYCIIYNMLYSLADIPPDIIPPRMRADDTTNSTSQFDVSKWPENAYDF